MEAHSTWNPSPRSACGAAYNNYICIATALSAGMAHSIKLIANNYQAENRGAIIKMNNTPLRVRSEDHGIGKFIHSYRGHGRWISVIMKDPRA